MAGKFERGNRVKVVSGDFQGRGGYIIEAYEPDDEELFSTKQCYLIKTDENGPDIKIHEDYLIRDTSSEAFMEETLYQQENFINKPKFKVGDVVSAPDPLDPKFKNLYAVRECIKVCTDDGVKYVYDVSPVNEYLCDQIERYDESDMIYRWYDKAWEDYFVESVGNGLPAWRGELYNLYELYINVRDHDSGFTEEAEEYYNHTIPPAYMEHILDRHTVYGRIKYVFASKANKELIQRKLNIREEPKLNKFVESFREKVEKRNGIEYTKGDPIHFSPKEIQFAELIDQLDTESIGNGETQYVDHYKLDLRNKDIMKMIQQAYKRAQKVDGKTTHQKTTDRRTGNEDYQNLGKGEYEGIANDGTVIHITYDFDVNVIDTAYPIKMNNNAKI